MTRKRAIFPSKLPRPEVIRLGFVPLCDCAPLVMAQELGLFEAHGLHVELSREVGWATVRDKVVLGELEAAHAPAAMVLAISLGIGSFKVPCLTGLILNLHGNAITLSNALRKEGVHDGPSLRQFIRSKPQKDPIVLGVAFSCSSHNFLLHEWLRAAGIDPREVRVVVVPPPQMVANLKAGNLHGYCVGEPWNSVAVIQRAGWVAALSPAVAPQHPEKALLVRADFAQARPREHEHLIAALHEACEFCQLGVNRERVVQTLARANYLNVSCDAVRRSLCGPFKTHEERSEPAEHLHLFAGPEVNEPGLNKARWALESLVKTGLLSEPPELGREELAGMFRSDIFHSALASSVAI